MKLLTKKIRQKLMKNAALEKSGIDLLDQKPAVKLFAPDAQLTWLLVSLYDNDIAFGLCDSGIGFPKLEKVSLEEIRAIRGHFNLSVTRDKFFKPTKSLKGYVKIARRKTWTD